MGHERTEMTDSMRGSMNLDGDVDKLRAFYDDWARTYDHDVASHDYGMPDMMRRTVADATTALDWRRDRADVVVLDAGCGTGQVGATLYEDGWTNLRGVDLSHEMIAIASERNLYRSLEAGVDLTAPLPDHLIACADIVTVGGVFTVGHVPPSALENVAALVRPAGVLVVSTREAYRHSTDWDDVATRMERAGSLSLVVHHEAAPYTMDSIADYWAWTIS